MVLNGAQLADAMQTAAAAITQKVYDNLTELNYHEIQELTNRSQELLIKSKAIYAIGVIEIASKLNESLINLSNAKDEIANAIKTINDVQKVINIVVGLVSIAGNVLTGNYSGTISSVRAILETI